MFCPAIELAAIGVARVPEGDSWCRVVGVRWRILCCEAEAEYQTVIKARTLEIRCDSTI